MTKYFQKKKIISIFLYILPILFFALSYFLMITSAEDVHQGANTLSNPISDAIRSFMWSARASDVYQFVSIRYYTYTSFEGSISNLVFRAIDVILAALFIYLSLCYVLSRRPKLDIKDALLANTFFAILICCDHSKVLYRGFSQINNYLFIGVSTLLFCIPFINEIREKHKPNWLFTAWMLIAGFLFGISHNITPLVFVLAYIIYLLYIRFVEKKKHVLKHEFSWWKVMAIVGLIIGVLFCYIIGPGVSGYAKSNYSRMYDYVSFSDIRRNPIKSSVKIVDHMISNFNSIIQPFCLSIIIGGVSVIYLKSRKNIKFKKWTRTERRTIVALLAYTIVYWLAMSQIKKLTRLYFPASIAFLILILYIFNHYYQSFKIIKIGKRLSTVAVIVVVSINIMALCARTCIAINYYQKTSAQLEIIKNAPKDTVCIPKRDTKERSYPVFNLSQESTFLDWTMPSEMYGKKVYFCKD